jgi:hypothetical protein
MYRSVRFASSLAAALLDDLFEHAEAMVPSGLWCQDADRMSARES